MSCFIFPDRPFLPWRLPAFGKTYQLRSHGITDLAFRCYALEQMPAWPVLWTIGSFSRSPLHLRDTSFSQPRGDGGERELRPKGWKNENRKQRSTAEISRSVLTGYKETCWRDVLRRIYIWQQFVTRVADAWEAKGEESRWQVCSPGLAQHCPLLCQVKVHQSSFSSYLMIEGLLHKHSAARDRERAMGHEISSSPISPVRDGLKPYPYFVRCQGRHTHSSACWKT